jgi:preprotein translocase subunit SecB
MSDKDKTTEVETTATEPTVPVMIHAQYIKDLSFENPLAPESLRAGKSQPEMDIDIQMESNPVTDEKLKNLYEVVLKLSATAKRDGEVAFIAEIAYGVTVSLGDLPEDQHHPFLLIEVPRQAFPFARQILGNITQQGGYAPLLLNPVDFQAMYMQRFAKKSQETAA